VAPALRIAGSGIAIPAHEYSQQVLSDMLRQYMFGDDWATRVETAEDVRLIGKLFSASGVEHRRTAVEVISYYSEPHTTGERMQDYERHAYPLAREALETSLRDSEIKPAALTDLILVSCTGYTAPGLDIMLARDLAMRPDVRRLIIGHMGCHGALIGLRSALAAFRAHEDGVIALITVELSSLHYNPVLDLRLLTGYALFADGAAAVVLSSSNGGGRPEVVDTYCAADFRTADQMTWRITDEGFFMGLSRRIPITLARNVDAVVEHLLGPHGLAISDISHWLVHPGGPDVLEVVARKLGLTDERLALSWQVLREHGNCSSATILIILDRLLRSGCPRPGDWGVLMAFGPGLTLETCLVRF
jgi:alkylresorcinol/alkylpyrone synthase